MEKRTEENISSKMLQANDSATNKLDQFNILSSIGKGQFGIIKKVEDSEKRIFAAKILDQRGSEKDLRKSCFMNEARILQLLDKQQCRYTIQFHKMINQGKYIDQEGVENEVSYYIMELAEYGTILDFIIQNRLSFSLRSKKQCFLQIAEGIEYLHSLGIIHQDIKESNIVVNKSGQLKLIDFGCSIQNGVNGIDTQNLKNP